MDAKLNFSLFLQLTIELLRSIFSNDSNVMLTKTIVCSVMYYQYYMQCK